MKFSFSLSKRFVFFILALPFLSIHSVSSLNLTNEYLNHRCLFDQGKYRSGSKYEENLNHAFHIMRDETHAETGFTHTSIGTPPDSVTVMLQCRGDTYGSKCHTCSDTALAGFRKRCPRNKGGIIWYDQCFLYISTIGEETPYRINYKDIFSMHNHNNVRGDVKIFTKRAMDFFSELILKVEKHVYDGLGLIFYAAGEKKLGKNKLYAMVQCIGLTLDCKSCLTWSIKKLFENGNIKQGARVLGTNCDVRYELYPFLRS
ncbi:unnamed protein product [Brassica rapa subsp. narinosa]|uniref:Gnk2-homologous domain-containing protein n=1 Tax=Brassica campestris TaxID=3711 RepID=M4CMT1_BRACM